MASPWMTQGPAPGIGMIPGTQMPGYNPRPHLHMQGHVAISPLAAGVGKPMEADPLVQRGRRFGADGMALNEGHAGPGVSPAATQAMLLSIGVPWLTFVLCMLLFLFLYEHSYGLVLLVLNVALVLFVSFYFQQTRKGLHLHAWVCAACAGTLIAGSFFGYYNYNRNIRDYWDYYDRRQYTNVWPSELADAHRDASVIVFADGTRPDPLSAMGFNFGVSGTACVAPIRMSNSDNGDAVQYWAVGVDCCAQQGEFSCGDIDVKNARAGLVVVNRTEPLFPLGVRISAEQYLKAAQMATARFAYAAAEQPIFVHWVSDVNASHDLLWTWSLLFFLKSSAAALVMCIFCATISPHMISVAKTTLMKKMARIDY